MICADCRATFDLSPGERQWYELNKLTAPRRCKPCRVARRANRDHEQRIEGVVTRVRAADGFIESAGRLFYFRHTDAPRRERLIPGMKVTFVVGSHWTGPHPRAALVRVAEVS